MCISASTTPSRCRRPRRDGLGALTSASNSIAVGNWFHAGYVMAGSGANNFRLFLNGNVVASTNGAATCNLQDLNLAREYNGRYLNARMDEVRTLERAALDQLAVGDLPEHRRAQRVQQLRHACPSSLRSPHRSRCWTRCSRGGGQFQFQIQGTPGYIHTLQTSTNLTSWENLYSWTPLAMPVLFSDTNTPEFPRRFFRLVMTP